MIDKLNEDWKGMEPKSKEKSWKDKISGLIFEEDSEDMATLSPNIPTHDKSSFLDQKKSWEDTAAVSETTATTATERTSISSADSTAVINAAEIYRSAGIAQDTFSTPEQVMELQSTFSDLPLEVQKQKVLKTLASFKVNINSVTENTQAKMKAMERYLQGIQAEAQSTIDTSGQTIVQLQLQINECRTRIAEAQSLMDQTTKQCQKEIDRLRSVLDFLGISSSPGSDWMGNQKS